MQTTQNTREKDLERAEMLLEEALAKTDLRNFDEFTVVALEEAMNLFEKWEVEEKTAEVYFQYAGYLNAQQKAREALGFHQKSLDIYLELIGEETEEVAKVYKEMGESYKILQDFDKMSHYINKALSIAIRLFGEIHPFVVYCYDDLAGIPFANLNYKAVIQIQQKPLNIAQKLNNPDLEAHIHGGLASAYLMLKDIINGEYHLIKQLALQQKYNFLSGERLAHLYYNLGKLYHSLADFQKAILFFKKALKSLYQENGKSNSFHAAYIYQQLGTVYSLKKDFSKSLEYNFNALQILREYGVDNHSLLGIIYESIAMDYFDLNDLKSAYKYLNKTLDSKLLFHKEENSAIASTYYLFGEYHLKTKNYAKSKEYYQKSQEMLDNDPNSLDADYFDLWSKMAGLCVAKGEYIKGLKHQHKALIHAIKHKEKTDLYEEISLSTIDIKKLNISYSYLIILIADKAYIFLEYYLNVTKDIKDLLASLQNYELIVQINDKIQSSFYSDESKLSSAMIINDYIVKIVYISYLLFQNSEQFRYLKTAFTFTEKSKAYLMLQNTQDKIAQKKASIPSVFLQEEEDLKNQLIRLEKSIKAQEQKENKTDDTLLQNLQNKYFTTFNEFEALKQKFEENYPDYYRQKYSTETISISSLQSSLQSHQTVLSYFIGGEKIYLFAITTDEYEVFAMEKPENWTDLIQHYLQSIKFHQKQTFQQLSFELYQALIQEAIDYLIDPFEEEARQVFIIPHAELHYLPFETLIIQEANDSDTYKDLDYLLQHCQISYHYSATLLHLDLQKQLLEENTVPTDIAFTGFAPVYEVSSNEQKQALEEMQQEYAAAVNRSEAVRGDGTWIPLPYSKLEVENIVQLFEQQGLKSQTFLHESATKRTLEKQIGKSRFVLIAAHGIVNDEFPELSGLVLAENGGRETVDGSIVENSPSFEEHGDIWNGQRSLIQKATDDCILNMKEVAMIPMNADLVVLSSCESGIGELHKGEGMMAVNRGFLTSGAKNVVSTLFKVNDRASSELTTLLFRYILEGDSYAMALQKAKLELLEKGGDVSPKIWSGFVLFGAGK